LVLGLSGELNPVLLLLVLGISLFDLDTLERDHLRFSVLLLGIE